MVLNHFARLGGEKTPAQLARIFHVTRGAMTNTLQRLDAAGFIHIRPDWDDARRKWVSLSPAGQAARDRAVLAIAPCSTTCWPSSVPSACAPPCRCCGRSASC